MPKPVHPLVAALGAHAAAPAAAPLEAVLVAMARSASRALDGAPINPSTVERICAAVGLDPTETLRALIAAEVLSVADRRITLGKVGRAFATHWYLNA